ncbi:MAG: hypothetical protein LBI36_05350 [Oscillospiraceae bacterium]|jgi:hypothetical protein|nr:hypothetical protein [Oscillospiraceae bacterium]
MAKLKELLDSRSNTFLMTEAEKEAERQRKISEIAEQVWKELYGVFANLTDEELAGTVIVSIRLDNSGNFIYTVSCDPECTPHAVISAHKCPAEDLRDALDHAFVLAQIDSIPTKRCGYIWQFIYSPDDDEDASSGEMTTDLSQGFYPDDAFVQKVAKLKERYAEADGVAINAIVSVGYDSLEELKKQLKKVNSETKNEEKPERERLSNAMGAFNAKRANELESVLKEAFDLMDELTKGK